jgi:tetratricopeptide (TPR) repeat protein
LSQEVSFVETPPSGDPKSFDGGDVFLLTLLVAAPLLAQEIRTIPKVSGTVQAEESLVGNRLSVVLVDMAAQRTVERSPVSSDGSFEFHSVAPGAYRAELVIGGDCLDRAMVNLNSSLDRIELRLSESGARKPGGVVSAGLLRLSGKSKRILEKAQKATASGDYQKSIEILRAALEDPAAAPYAYINIGANYLRAGQPSAAIPQFQEAARLLPGDVMAHTNLAFALLLLRKLEEAEQEARAAVTIDKHNAKANWVLGSILANQGSDEAVDSLRVAAREFPQARVMLARYYERRGQSGEAANELRAFLPNASDQERPQVEQWISRLVAK